MCGKLKSITFVKDKLNTSIDTEVIIIFFHRFVLDSPIRLKKDDHVYIRRQSETTQASTDEIIQLTKKLTKKW